MSKKIKSLTIDDFTMEGEQWAFIVDYPNYFVSNYGRVYSGYENRILKGDYTKKGYHRVPLKGIDGVCKSKRVSHLVAAAFIPWYNPKIHKEVHHINNNESDDRVINLMPVTPKAHWLIHHVLYKRFFKYPHLIVELFKIKVPNIHISINIDADNDIKGGDAA